MKYNAGEFIKVLKGLSPASRNGAGATNGAGWDCKGYEEALVILSTGIHGAGGTNAVKIQESSDDASADPYADVTGAAFTTVTDGTDEKVYVGRIDLKKRERYLRAVATDAVGAVICGIDIVLLAAKILPVTQENTIGFSV